MAKLSSLDLLLLSETEQRVVRCLVTQPGLMLAEIAQKVQLPIHELEETVKRLVDESRLVEQFQDGQCVFSVRFKREQQRVRNIPSAISGLFDQ